MDFGRRRQVAREHVGVLRALWGPQPAEWHGETIDLLPCWSEPTPSRRIPVLIGGGAGPLLLGAVAEYGDGWLPVGGAGLGEALPRLRRLVDAAGRDPDDVTVVPFGTLPSAGKLAHLADLGITEAVLRVRAGPATMLADDRHTAFL